MTATQPREASSRPAARRSPSGGPSWRAGAAVTALVLAVAAVAALLLGVGQSSYTISALFEDAGQLVTGGLVEVAGREVGTISSITLTANGLADVRLSIDDPNIEPLHEGTRAIIRAVGQAGVANRFVELSPGPLVAPSLRDGAVLPTKQTTGIVDLDAVLDTFTPSTRSALQQLIANSAQVFAGSGSRYFNQMLGKLNPALAALDGLSGQLADDHTQLAELVQTAATASTAINSRRADLVDAVTHTAQVMSALASERGALGDILQRAPAVLNQARGTLANVASTVTVLRPTLRSFAPVQRPLQTLLATLTPTLRQAQPVISDLDAQLPALRSTLAGFEPLRRPLDTALTTTAKALRSAMPILAGLRIYGSDFILGILNGLAGFATGNYDAVGHYARLEFVQSPQTLFEGIASQLFSTSALIPGILGTRTHLLARCPGGNAPPAPDGSNPWIPDRSLCNPADDVPLSVNFP